MTDIEPFIYMLLFVAGLALCESLLLFFTDKDKDSQRRVAQERLKRHASRLQSTSDADVRSILRDEETRGPIIRFLTALVPNRRPLDLPLYRAGLRVPLETFVGLCVLLSVLGFFIGTFILRQPPVGLALIGIGVFPVLYATRAKRGRMRLFMEQLPEAIDLLCRSLKAGHPFNTGLSLAAKEIEDPASAEFEQVVEEISLGLDPRVALTNLSMRMTTPDMPFFVNAVLIQRETGGDLPRVLGGLANTMRERIKFQIKLESIVAQTKLSANALALLPFAFMGLISYVAPDYTAPLFELGPGRNILYLAFTFTIVGWIACRRLAVVKT